jgi:hypothetical protein
MINAAIGGLTNANLDTKQQELAAALRQKQATQLEQYGQLEQQDKAAALRFALSSDNPILRDIAKEELKGIKLEENAIYQKPSLFGGMTELKGNPKYKAPIHYDLGSYISVRDPNDVTKEIQRLPKGISPESAARLADEGIGGYGGGAARPVPQPTINPGSPIIQKPGVSLIPNAPAYAQNALTMKPVVGENQVNSYEEFNKSLVPPAGLPPKDQRKWNAEVNSPLTGEAAKQVTGAINTIGAIDNYRNLVSEAARTGIVSPEQRAKLEAARNTMNLLGKEAYNLGVLNGPDLTIMNSLSVDFNNPKSLLLSKETLDGLVEKQRSVMGTTVQNVYGIQQKKIPEYVINKLKPVKTEITPAQAGKIERPSIIDETTWGFMTPQEKSLFKR